jgi:RNA polymerase sigma-70 factor (ECF subfamily)
MEVSFFIEYRQNHRRNQILRDSNKKAGFCVHKVERSLAVAIPFTAQEAELVTRARNGDRNAFGELVGIHAPGVMNVIYRMCGDVHIAEDAAQETFIQAWVHFASYRPGQPLRNWLYRIGVNAATDMLRKQKRIAFEDLEDLPLSDPQPGPEALFSQEERTGLVQKAVLSLPDASRAVLVLREYEGLSYHEIADTLNIPLGTVMSRLNYARKLLKEKLEQSPILQMEAEYV